MTSPLGRDCASLDPTALLLLSSLMMMMMMMYPRGRLVASKALLALARRGGRDHFVHSMLTVLGLMALPQ